MTIEIIKEARMGSLQRKNTQQRLYETWAKTDIGAGLDEIVEREGADKGRLVAQALYNEEFMLKNDSVQEATISTQFGVKPEMVLRVVRIGTANSNISRMFNEYQLTSTDDAIYYVDPIYGRTKRGGTAGEVMYEQDNRLYATEAELQSIGTGNGSTTNFTGTLSKTPVVPYKVTILLAGIPVASDDGSGLVVGAALSAGTIDYATGAIDITFNTAPATGVDISTEYNFNSELESNFAEYGVVDITVRKDNFRVRPDPISYRISAMSEILLETGGLLEGPAAQMIIWAGQEHARMRDYRAIRVAYRESLNNTITTFDTDFSSVGEISDKSHAQRLWSTISNVVADVYKEKKRGGVATIIAAEKAVVYMQKHEKWVDDTSQPRFGCYLAGRIGPFEVFQIPSDDTSYGAGLAENEILITLKGNTDAGDIALAVGFLREIKAELVYPSFNREGSLATIWDTKVINQSFFRLIRLENLDF